MTMRRYAVAPDHGRPSSDEPEAGIGMSRTTHSMHGKTVLITGATGGIGRAAAIGLLALMHPSAWKKSSRNFGCRGF
jgi:NADPH:quinone reductase-like Zn-dependent oxidoreductase